MLGFFVIYAVVTFASALEQYSHEHHCSNVVAVPSNICGNTDVLMCEAVSALKFCQNTTVMVAKGSKNVVITNGESYVMNLSTANASAQLVVMSSDVVRVLTEHVFLSSTAIARAIVKLTQHFGWSRLTIVADTADTYFLRTAEQLYRMANLSPDSRLLQLSNSDSEIKDLVNRVDKLNLKIIVLSLRPHLLSKLLCRGHEKHLVWPEYAWIVHSVEVNEGSCRGNSTLDGVITVHLNDTRYTGKQYHDCFSENQMIFSNDVRYINSCHISDSSQQSLNAVWGHIGKQFINETDLIGAFPSDLPPQYVPTVYLTLFYIANTVSFIICMVSSVLYVKFRNEPAVKATSVFLSMLIFAGCYLTVLHLYVTASFNVPSLYKRSKALRDCMCVSTIWLNGLAFPAALILSTLLVKLLRVYRLFKVSTRVTKLTTSNLALAGYVLLMTSPNALVSFVWTIADPNSSTVLLSVRNGLLHVSVICSYDIRWLLIQFVYFNVLSFLLIIFAILTRKIKYRDFKDTKKVSVLSFVLVFLGSTGLFYWYLLLVFGADILVLHTALHVSHLAFIFSCQGFIFAPKLFPIVKDKLMHTFRYRGTRSKTVRTINTSVS